jgi:hypothetical protein
MLRLRYSSLSNGRSAFEPKAKLATAGSEQRKFHASSGNERFLLHMVNLAKDLEHLKLDI